jgi:hypothetical protein
MQVMTLGKTQAASPCILDSLELAALLLDLLNPYFLKLPIRACGAYIV